MKTVTSTMITDLVASLVARACCVARPDIRQAIARARAQETFPRAERILEEIARNHEVAAREELPLCQDTGLDSVFVTMGNDVHLIGDLESAVNEGVAHATERAALRASIVSDPFNRVNTGTNAPAFLHVRLTSGTDFTIQVLAKGAGCENVGQSSFLLPGTTEREVTERVIALAREAGGKACPPYIVSVACGGDGAESAAAAKSAFLHPLDWVNPAPAAHALESSLLSALNATGIGPMGLGGRVTALRVFVTLLPCHIASFPLAVAFSCHALRSAEGSL